MKDDRSDELTPRVERIETVIGYQWIAIGLALTLAVPEALLAAFRPATMWTKPRAAPQGANRRANSNTSSVLADGNRAIFSTECGKLEIRFRQK